MKKHLKLIGASLMIAGGALMLTAGTIALASNSPLNVALFMAGVVLLGIGPSVMVFGNSAKRDSR